MSLPKPPSGHFAILYFAAATSYTRKPHDFLPAPLPVDQLYHELDKRYPGIKEKVLSSALLTVNLDYVDVEEEAGKGDKIMIIQAGDEVAIIPPHYRGHEILTMASPKPQTITYKTVGKLEIPFDLYLPDDAKNVPVLLWFHGGGLLQGVRRSVTPHMLQAVSKYNIALISADYRLAPQVGVAEIFEDVKDCVAFIRSRLDKFAGEGVVDTTRLAVSGSSAGGYLAFLAGLYIEPKPKVILPIYPITDPLGTFFTTSQPHPFGGGRTDPEPLAEFLDPNAEVVANSAEDSKRNQLYFVMMQEANLASLLRIKPGDDTFRIAKKVYERKLPPTYVVHGDADGAVGVEQADEVVGVMVGLGMEVQYERLHGIDHLFDRDAKYQLEGMYEFMMKHL
ncbi:hypothetical protein LTR85_003845 [Meristemomyces frigidus]|nr:hypothetical protein LTR85_003845 [Meristemomyces frigidus]